MQKRQIFAIAVVSLAALFVAGQVSVGQSQPRWVTQHGPPSGPPALPSYLAPQVVVGQPASPGMPETSLGQQAQPAFRITVVKDADRNLAQQVSYMPQEAPEAPEAQPAPVQPEAEPQQVAPNYSGALQSGCKDACSGACQGGCKDVCGGACQTSCNKCAQPGCYGDCGKGCDVGCYSDYSKGCDVGYAAQKSCGCIGDCCCYCVRVYGEFLQLRARDSEVTYAVDANSNEYEMLGPEFPIQVSPYGVLDQDYSSGFRFGFGICVDSCSELSATYTWFDTATSDQIVKDINTNIPNIVPMTAHPATMDNLSSSVAGWGRHDIGFEMIDLDYRRTFWDNGCSELNYVLGARWGQLEQAFGAQYGDDPQQPFNTIEVATDIDFSGGGIHLGLEGERRGCVCHVPLILYAKGLTSILAGQFDATYTQTGQNGSINMVDTGWAAGRIVPTFDLEVGGGIATPGGTFRATVGYVYSSWANVVKTEDWIRAVQTNNPKDIGDTMTFDGLVGRIEARF